MSSKDNSQIFDGKPSLKRDTSVKPEPSNKKKQKLDKFAGIPAAPPMMPPMLARQPSLMATQTSLSQPLDISNTSMFEKLRGKALGVTKKPNSRS